MAKKEVQLISAEDLPPRIRRLRFVTRFLYDVQKLRVAAGNRNAAAQQGVQLLESDQAYLRMTAAVMQASEDEASRLLAEILKGIPIWETWLKDQRGVGTRLGAILLSELDPYKAETISGFWRYAGLGVDPATGKAERRVRGQKCAYSPWLKSKLTKVLGECLLKASGKVKDDADPGPWYTLFANEKNRLTNKIVPVCQLCNGTGKTEKEVKGESGKAKDKDAPKEIVKCWNCDGTGGPAPYGKGAKHRYQMALRKACKGLLAELYKKWRTLEGLPVRPPYSEEYLAVGKDAGWTPSGGDFSELTSANLRGGK